MWLEDCAGRRVPGDRSSPNWFAVGVREFPFDSSGLSAVPGLPFPLRLNCLPGFLFRLCLNCPCRHRAPASAPGPVRWRALRSWAPGLARPVQHASPPCRDRTRAPPSCAMCGAALRSQEPGLARPVRKPPLRCSERARPTQTDRLSFRYSVSSVTRCGSAFDSRCRSGARIRAQAARMDPCRGTPPGRPHRDLSRNTMHSAGTTTSNMSGPISKPPTTTVAKGRCTWLPMPVEIAAGNRPMDADSAVISIGRIR